MAKSVSRSNSFLTGFKNLSIGKKLASGFGIVFFIFVALVIFIQYKLTVQDTLQTQIVEQRFPTNIAGHDLVNGINASLAALRGYMILGTDAFKQQRLQAWEDIDKKLATLTDNSSNWMIAKDITALKDLKTVMAEYKSAQQQVEEISQSEDERPATKILINEASPHARKIISAINRMLNEEKKLPATAERKELFSILSDSRGSFSLALTSIRSYLISADQKTIDLFNKRWRINTSKLKGIQQRVDLLNEKQLGLFKTYVEEREQFEPLATKMLEIRGSDKWNMANYLLAQEAAPRAIKALKILDSIVENQNNLVAQDVKTLQSESASINTISVIATIVTLIIGLLIAKLITGNIVTSFAEAISVTKRIASGDLSGKIIINSSDETGQLLTSLQQMQQQLINVIERDVQSIVDTAKEGDLAQRIRLEDKEGFYKKLSSSINELVDVNEQVIEDTVRMFGALANGDLTQRIDADYQGAFNKLKQDANQTVNKLTQVIEGDIQTMVDASLNGDLNQRIDLSDKQGFFESMSQGINNLVESVNHIFQDASSSMKSMSQGDLTQPITRHYHGQFDELKNNINETLANLDKTMTTLIESSQSITAISSEISDGNKSLSSRTEHQAGSLEQTATSMEELTSTVKNNAENSQQAVQLAKEAQLAAVQGGEIMQDASVAMTEINRSSDQIAEIIGVIDEIAFQTNLLALNASVEAARAGEQGRGFAVVATEVRNLAGRSATAAKEIKGLINDSGDKVKSGVNLIEKSTKSQNEIVESISRVENIISEISNASLEQSDGIEQVNTAVTSMDEVTQQNAALAEQTSASAVALTDKAGEMSGLMNFFTVSQSATYKPETKVLSTTEISSKNEPDISVTPTPQTTDTGENVDDDWEEF